MKTRRSWQEKMDNPNLPKVVATRTGDGTMLIASPRQVEALIRTVKKGHVTTVSRMRETLAAQHMTDTTCPLTTGMFVRLAAEAAEEAARGGKTRVTPYWRVVKEDGQLNAKFPGGVEGQAEKLRAEGIRILPGKGKRAPRVAGMREF